MFYGENYQECGNLIPKASILLTIPSTDCRSCTWNYKRKKGNRLKIYRLFTLGLAVSLNFDENLSPALVGEGDFEGEGVFLWKKSDTA